MKMSVLQWTRTRNTGHCGHITEGNRKFFFTSKTATRNSEQISVHTVTANTDSNHTGLV